MKCLNKKCVRSARCSVSSFLISTQMQKQSKLQESDSSPASPASVHQHPETTSGAQHEQSTALHAIRDDDVMNTNHSNDTTSGPAEKTVSVSDDVADQLSSAATAAITARLQAEYFRPSRYSSNIFVDADPRSSIQKNIQTLLRGSSSSVALSNRTGQSPFLERVVRVPLPPPGQKTGAGRAFAKRPLSVARDGAVFTDSVLKLASAAGALRADASLSRTSAQGDPQKSLFPPLTRKRS